MVSGPYYRLFFSCMLLYAICLPTFLCLSSCHSSFRKSYAIPENAVKNRIFITGTSGFEPLWLENKFRRSGLQITDSVPHLNIWIAEFDTLATDPAKLAHKLRKTTMVKDLEFDRRYNPVQREK